MKKVEELKAGMEVWMKFSVDENQNKEYPFALINGDYYEFFTKDCKVNIKDKPIKIFTIDENEIDENEIPELKGVEMEVSGGGEVWTKAKVYCKAKNGYITDFGFYEFARPIQKTFDLSNVPEHLLTDELKQYLR